MADADETQLAEHYDSSLRRRMALAAALAAERATTVAPAVTPERTTVETPLLRSGLVTLDQVDSLRNRPITMLTASVSRAR